MLFTPASVAIATDGSVSDPAREIALWGLDPHTGAGACTCGSCSRDCSPGADPAMPSLASLPGADGGRATVAEAMVLGSGVRSTVEAVE